MKVMVLGGNGQLGHALQRVLQADQVMPLELPDLDITNRNSVRYYIKEEKPECVINAAAFSDVDGAETQPPFSL